MKILGLDTSTTSTGYAVLDNEKLRKIKIVAKEDINSFITDLIREMEIA